MIRMLTTEANEYYFNLTDQYGSEIAVEGPYRWILTDDANAHMIYF